jgi:hypothetical protein
MLKFYGSAPHRLLGLLALGNIVSHMDGTYHFLLGVIQRGCTDHEVAPESVLMDFFDMLPAILQSLRMRAELRRFGQPVHDFMALQPDTLLSL